MPDADGDTLVLRSRIPPNARGSTLLDYLTSRFRYHDAAGWREALNRGALELDGRRASGDERLRAGMRLSYTKQHREPPVATAVTVLYRDAALLVVDKPAHLPVHADGPFIRNTLIALLRERLGAPDLQLVHRLDRETSGVCLLAADRTVQAALQSQFGSGAVAKHYLAVVRGRVAAPFTVDLPIGHAAHSAVRLRRSAAPDAIAPLPASTEFEPVRGGSERTLLRCRPRTGRTHQIRVHLEAQGHPVVGDKLYGQPDERYLAFVRRVKSGGSVFEPDPAAPDVPNRHLLHAHALSFVHPTTGAPARFEAPLPAEFERWLTGTCA